MKQRYRRLGLLSLALLAVADGTASAAPRPDPDGVAPEPPARPRKPPGGTTLDPSLERAAERLLRGAKPVEGAVVALDPKTGRVLAWSAIASSGSSFEVLPQARLPAASLFKVVTTTALFESTTLTPQDHVCING